MTGFDDVASIRDVIDRYAVGIDRRDWVMVANCFTDDCQTDYGRSGRWTGRAVLISALEEMHAAVGPTLHRITNHIVDLAGSNATTISYLDALLRVEHRGFDLLHVAATYADSLRLTSDGWRISERHVQNFLWRREHAASTSSTYLQTARIDQD